MAWHVFVRNDNIEIDDLYMGTHRIDREVIELAKELQVRIILNPEKGVIIEPISN